MTAATALVASSVAPLSDVSVKTDKPLRVVRGRRHARKRAKATPGKQPAAVPPQPASQPLTVQPQPDRPEPMHAPFRRPSEPKPEPVQRQEAADPHRAVARTRRLRGEAVLLERDLASALGTLPGRLADLAWRHAEWFPEGARFALSAQECAEQGLSTIGEPPVAYSAQGLVAAAHWLCNEARRQADAYAETEDLERRFQIAWMALGAGGGRI